MARVVGLRITQEQAPIEEPIVEETAETAEAVVEETAEEPIEEPQPKAKKKK